MNTTQLLWIALHLSCFFCTSAATQPLPETTGVIQVSSPSLTLQGASGSGLEGDQTLVTLRDGDDPLWTVNLSFRPTLGRATDQGAAILAGYETDEIGTPARYSPTPTSSLYFVVVSQEGQVFEPHEVIRGQPQYAFEPAEPALPYFHSVFYSVPRRQFGILLVISPESSPQVRWVEPDAGKQVAVTSGVLPMALRDCQGARLLDLCWSEEADGILELWSGLLCGSMEGRTRLIRLVDSSEGATLAELSDMSFGPLGFDKVATGDVSDVQDDVVLLCEVRCTDGQTRMISVLKETGQDEEDGWRVSTD